MDSLRFILCALCGQLFFLCRRCDRNHRYGSLACRHIARLAVQRRAQRIFHQSLAGRQARADRQARYRETRTEADPAA